MVEYDIEDVIAILKNLKNNPYSIKHVDHFITRSRDRFINLNLIYKKLNQEKPVAIEKEANSSSRFLLIYEFEKFRDLAIVIDILNENEILILTVIDKSIKRRKH